MALTAIFNPVAHSAGNQYQDNRRTVRFDKKLTGLVRPKEEVMAADPKDFIAVKKMEQRQFAGSQMRELIKCGLSQKEAAQVLRAAGPTWCVKAVEWGKQAFDTALRPLRKGYGGFATETISDAEHHFAVADALDCLLTGAGGRNGFGKERMERALRVFNLEPPDVPTSFALFAVLRGAREVIVAAHASVRQSDPLTNKKKDAKKEPVLCYVDGSTAYFTTQELSKQWGDDWNDAPYEHNAGTPYDPCWHSEPQHRKDGKLCPCNICERDWNKDGTPKWQIVKVTWEGPFATPADLNEPNSPFSVEDINSGATPWLKTTFNESGPYAQVMAEATISEFVRVIESVGGRAAIEK